MKKLSIIIPCYNGDDCFDFLIAEIIKLNQLLEKKILIEYVLVNDGSTDNTWEEMIRFQSSVPRTRLIQLSGNFGSYSAFLAGLSQATGDCFAQLHTDLQDPPNIIPEMLDYWEKGVKLVIGQRTRREEGKATVFFARIYHKVIKKIALPHVPEGGYDLILFDKELRDLVVGLNESNINLVYLISSFKHPYVTIPVTRVRRPSGRSGWTLKKKIKLVVDSLVGFSYFPIQLLSFICLAFFFGSIVSIISLFIEFSAYRLLFFVILISSFMLSIMLVIIGEYLWRTLEASRKRPPYVIDKILD